MARDLVSKVAIVTGGARNIGKAIAERFAAEGATVVITCRTGSEGEAAAAGIVARGGKATYMRQDVSKGEDWREVIDRTVKAHGSVDIIVHCAGFSTAEPILEGKLETLRKTLDINMRSCFLALKYGVKPMRAQGGGAIVVISSTSGMAGFPSYSAYCASKGGEMLMTKAAALEFAADHIRVNSVAPGICRYTMTAEIDPALDEYIPLKRRGEASEIAAAALFLASDRSSSVTGTTLVVDGGMLAI